MPLCYGLTFGLTWSALFRCPRPGLNRRPTNYEFVVLVQLEHGAPPETAEWCGSVVRHSPLEYVAMADVMADVEEACEAKAKAASTKGHQTACGAPSSSYQDRQTASDDGSRLSARVNRPS